MRVIKLMRMRVIKVEANELTRKNVEYLGTDVSAKFSQIYTVTRCDTTSFYTVMGKILSKVFKNFLIGKEKLILLNTIGVSCKVLDAALKDVEKFIQIVCYSGNKEESLTEIRVRLYKNFSVLTTR